MPKTHHFDSIESSKDLLYEISMIFYTLKCLSKNPSKFDRFVYFEDFLLHARNLHYFFAKRRSHNHDLHISDYVDMANQTIILKEIIDKQLLIRINKHLAHLDKNRKHKIKVFECIEIAKRIIVNIDSFINNINPNDVCDMFILQCEELINDINTWVSP